MKRKTASIRCWATNLSIEEKTKFEEYLDVESEENEDLTEDENSGTSECKGAYGSKRITREFIR